MAVLDRLMLGDEQWERISRHIIGDGRTRGSPGRDNRMSVEAVLWIVRTGSPWRDLPDVFGAWNSAFRRLSRWSAKPVLSLSKGASGIVSSRPSPTMATSST